MQKYYPIKIKHKKMHEGAEVEATRSLVLGFNNATYEQLFTELGFDPQQHDRARKDLARLNAKLQAGTATDEEQAELMEFDLVDLFNSDMGDMVVATKLLYAAALEQQPDLTYEELASMLNASVTRDLVREALLPCLFAYYGVDFSGIKKQAEDEIEKLMKAAAEEGAEGKSGSRPKKRAGASKTEKKSGSGG